MEESIKERNSLHVSSNSKRMRSHPTKHNPKHNSSSPPKHPRWSHQNSSCGTEVALFLDLVNHFILWLLHISYNRFVTVIYHKTVAWLYYFLKKYFYEHSCLLGELTAHCVGPHKVAYCELYDHGDGTFTLNVKPQEAGRHALTIKYGGKYHPSPVQSLCAPYFPLCTCHVFCLHQHIKVNYRLVFYSIICPS